MNIERIYNEAKLSVSGITLAEFRANPTAVLRQCGQETAPACIESGFRPLLPRQAMVAKRLQEEWSKENRVSKSAPLASSTQRPATVRPAIWPTGIIPC